MRYIIGLLAIVVLIIFGVVLFAGDNNQKKSTTEQGMVLNDYADSDASVVLTIDGPIVAKEEHSTVRITVSRNQRKLEVIKGYESKAVRTETFTNTQSAYEAFLFALGNVGFTEKRDAAQESFMGVCPEDNRYIYEISENGQNIQQLWSADCGRTVGTMAGDDDDIRGLFENQIPNYDDITEDIDI